MIAGTRRLVELGEVPGGTRANLAHAAPFTSFSAEVHADVQAILADAQTSGGLLAAVPADAVQAFHAAWIGERGDAAVIGRVTGPGTGRIAVSWRPADD